MSCFSKSRQIPLFRAWSARHSGISRLAACNEKFSKKGQKNNVGPSFSTTCTGRWIHGRNTMIWKGFFFDFFTFLCSIESWNMSQLRKAPRNRSNLVHFLPIQVAHVKHIPGGNHVVVLLVSVIFWSSPSNLSMKCVVVWSEPNTAWTNIESRVQDIPHSLYVLMKVWGNRVVWGNSDQKTKFSRCSPSFLSKIRCHLSDFFTTDRAECPLSIRERIAQKHLFLKKYRKKW